MCLDFNIYDIDESYFQENDVTDLELKFDSILVISDMKFIHSIPYSPNYVIIFDGPELSDQIDLLWCRFHTHRIISFSRVIHEKLRSCGLNSAYFQYYPQPDSDEIQWAWRDDTFKLSIISDQHQHQASRFSKLLSYLDILNDGNLRLVEEEIRFCDLNRLIKSHDIFMICGSSYENLLIIIWLMGRGKVVIARDCPWASDYIGHLSSGIIDDGSQFAYHPALDKKSLRAIGYGARYRTLTGHRRWLNDRTRLLSLLVNDGQRWWGGDRSASFGNRIRCAASNSAYESALRGS